MTKGQEKFFVCGNEDVTALVFKAKTRYKIVFEDEIQYMVRDEMGEINYLNKNTNNMSSPRLDDSSLCFGKVMTREEIEEGEINGI